MIRKQASKFGFDAEINARDLTAFAVRRWVAANVERPPFGDTTVTGTNGSDSLTGTPGDDSLAGLDGNDTLRGRNGADVLDGGQGKDWADYRGAAKRVLVNLESPTENTNDAAGDSYSSIENVRGSGRDDTLIGDLGDNIIDGGKGDDRLDGGEGINTLFGGKGFDEIFGGGGSDRLNGGAFDDSLIAGNGSDIVVGGDGRDTLSGEDGDDLLFGGEGADYISASIGQDTLRGGGGGDTLDGGPGADLLDGGEGMDWVRYGGIPTSLVANLASPSKNQGDAFGDKYVNVENLRGGSLNDTLRGDSEDNILEGMDGDDAVFGRDGDDTLINGPGTDKFKGGDGADVFLFNDIGNPRSELIIDFSDVDTIALRASEFGLPRGNLAYENFVLGDHAQEIDDYLIYDPTTGRLFLDRDGSGSQPQLLFATFKTLPALSASDFIVV